MSVNPEILNPVNKHAFSFKDSTIGAAVDLSVVFESVPYDNTAAMFAFWGKLADSTLKAIEYIIFIIHDYLKGFVVIISAFHTSGHNDWIKKNLRVSRKRANHQYSPGRFRDLVLFSCRFLFLKKYALLITEHISILLTLYFNIFKNRKAQLSCQFFFCIFKAE
jgi:hypothetical protein